MASSTISQPNAKTFTPEDIVTEVRAGRVRVPSFQRKFRWQWEDVRRLFDSIAKGYPIGDLLLWERPAEEARIQVGALSVDAPAGPALYVVDGQQRVTSLANALTAEGAVDPRFSLAFNLKTEDFQRHEQLDSEYLVPLHVIFDLQELLAWFAERPELKGLLERATRVAKAIRQYAIPAYVVKQQDEEVLRDIFDRMNNYGRRLTRAEVFSALHGGTGRDGSNLHFSDIAEAVDDETRFGKLDDDTVLKAVLARRSQHIMRDIRTEFDEDRGVRDFSGEEAASAYQEGQRALVNAIRFIQADAGVPHLGFLPYRYLIVVLTRFFALYPSPSPRNRTLLRRFFWRAALVGPHAFRGITITMQVLARCIIAGDESGSVQRLLNALSEHKIVPPSLIQFYTKAAESRVILCALWALKPMSPVNGTMYDIDAITSVLRSDTMATSALGTFFPRAPQSLRGWAANRAILLDEVEETGDARTAFTERVALFDAKTRTKILKSHALDAAMVKCLDRGEVEEFLKERQERLGEVLRGFIEKVTESSFEDTRPLDDFNLDEAEERDDEIRE